MEAKGKGRLHHSILYISVHHNQLAYKKLSILNILKIKNLIKEAPRDFTGGPMLKNPPSNAGDVGSIPDQGTKIPHAAGQLSPRATTTEPGCLN